MKAKTFDVWVRRDHYFTAKIKAQSLAHALEIALSMKIDQLIDAPGETIDSEHKITGVME